MRDFFLKRRNLFYDFFDNKAPSFFKLRKIKKGRNYLNPYLHREVEIPTSNEKVILMLI
jgi:hypothetical protein